MATCRAIVMVEPEAEDGIERAVEKEYPGSSMVRLERIGGSTYATFHIRTHGSCGAVDAYLHGMSGVAVLSVARSGAGLPPNLKARSFWAVVAMSAAWTAFAAVGFLVPGSPLDALSQAQVLVVQMTFPLAVAIVVYMHDREAVGYVAEGVDKVHFLASEINERVRRLSEGRR